MANSGINCSAYHVVIGVNRSRLVEILSSFGTRFVTLIIENIAKNLRSLHVSRIVPELGVSFNAAIGTRCSIMLEIQIEERDGFLKSVNFTMDELIEHGSRTLNLCYKYPI
jgi:uncharacterized membrane protein